MRGVSMPTTHEQRRRAFRLAAEILVAAAALALLTWAAVRLQLPAEPAAVLYLILVILVSLRGRRVPALFVAVAGTAAWDYFFTARSEERRVGKECRSRWWPYN